MKRLTQHKKIMISFVLVCLLVLNYPIIITALDSNLFGIIFSIVLFIIGGRKTNLKMSYPLLGMVALLEYISFQLHTKSLHFLALAILVCFVYYSFTRKFSFIAFICVILFSSIFNTFFNYLTVEIKQTLCYGVYLSLKNFIPITKIEGVKFYINNAKITIDTACMGLSMFKTGLLVGAFLLTLEERKQQKYFNIKQIFLFCFLIILLNIISNYFRIIILILFDCTQENTLHYSIGLLCFVFYQILPILYLIRFFKPKKEEIINVNSSKFAIVSVITGFAIVLVTSLEIKKEQRHNLLENLDSSYNIQQGIWVNTEVFKIATPNKLVYIKTPTHNPLICWTGTGYKIIESKIIIRNNEKISFVLMEKNGVQYFSYWWYECDNKKYTSLVEVLLIKLFYNKSARLINETSKTKLT
ncbi:exosortase N [Flavobacterium sp.]|uniref:exosortase N n=1 Tax=Flavobacterium sp. TaxID=239 RepID=UPI00374D5D5D